MNNELLKAQIDWNTYVVEPFFLKNTNSPFWIATMRRKSRIGYNQYSEYRIKMHLDLSSHFS